MTTTRTRTVHGALHSAYLDATEAATAAAQAWADDDTATLDDLAHPARIATEAADAARDAARAAWLASDEPREYQLCEGDHWYSTVVAASLEDALEAARDGVDHGNYDDDRQSTLRIQVRARCVETGDEDSDTVVIDPAEPECADGCEHDWCSPHDVVGGLRENPGVYGHGGGVISTEVCSHCGAYRTTDGWATDRADGTQGHTEISYRHADDSSRSWVESKG